MTVFEMRAHQPDRRARRAERRDLVVSVEDFLPAVADGARIDAEGVVEHGDVVRHQRLFVAVERRPSPRPPPPADRSPSHAPCRRLSRRAWHRVVRKRNGRDKPGHLADVGRVASASGSFAGRWRGRRARAAGRRRLGSAEQPLEERRSAAEASRRSRRTCRAACAPARPKCSSGGRWRCRPPCARSPSAAPASAGRGRRRRRGSAACRRHRRRRSDR